LPDFAWPISPKKLPTTNENARHTQILSKTWTADIAISIGASIALSLILAVRVQWLYIWAVRIAGKIYKRSAGVIKNKFYARALTAVGVKKKSKNI